MKILKAAGILLLFISGFFAHAVLASNRPLQAKLYLGIIILVMIHVSIAAIVVKNGKTFKEGLAEAIVWPLNFLP